MKVLPRPGCLSKRILLFVLWSSVLALFAQPASGQNFPPPTGALLDLSGTPIPGGGNMTYQQYSVNFTATLESTTITFAFREDPAQISFANASVTDLEAPEVNLLLNGDFSGGLCTSNGNTFAPCGWTYDDQFGSLVVFGVVQSRADRCYTSTYCWFDGTVQGYDGIGQAISTVPGHTYQISFFVADNSGCVINGIGGPPCNFSDISTNGDVTDQFGNGINVVVYAQGAAPSPSKVNQTFQTSGPTTTTFNSEAGKLVQQTFDTTKAADHLSCNGPDNGTVDCTGVQLSSTNTTLSNSDPTWPPYVFGTPWATSLCAVRPGDGADGTLCSLYVNACFGGNSGVSLAQASDFYCPYVNTPDNPSTYITLKDTWDPSAIKPPITPGTTVSLITFVPTSPTETWSASANSPNPVCTQVAPIVNPSTAAQCDIFSSLVDVYGDQTTTRGTSPKKGWLISVFNVPMLLTSVQVFPNLGTACPLKGNPVVLNDPPVNDGMPGTTTWNNGACMLGFLVNPAAAPAAPNNNFVAAPPASLFYGPGEPAVTPGPIPEGDSGPLANPNPVCTGAGTACSAQPWETGGLQTLSSVFGPQDGTFTLHWSAKDTAGIAEKNIQLTNAVAGSCPTPDGPVAGTQCYSTSYFTTTVNIDSTLPTVSLTFSPAGAIYSVNQAASAIFSCNDPLSNGVASGVASCKAVVDAGSPVNYPSAAPLNTATAGAHKVTVTAVDHAGNTASQVFNYTVLPDADVAIFEQHTSDSVKPGGTLTYLAWALDLSKTNAAEVTATVQIQLPAAGVNLGNVTASMALVACSLSGCTSMPPSGGSNCSVSGTTITCNIGTLPSIYTLKGVIIKTSIPVLSTSKPGTAFKLTATVNSPNDPNPKNNTTTDLLSVSYY